MGDPSMIVDDVGMSDISEETIVRAVRIALRAVRDEPSRTLGEALDRYEKEHLPHLAPNTQDWRSRAIGRLRSRFGKRAIRGSWLAEANSLFSDVNLTPTSAAMMCNTLGRILNLAQGWKWVDEPHSIGKLGWLRGEGKDLPYKVEDARLVLAAIFDIERQRSKATSRSTCGLRFLALTGWRPSEITNLRWDELRQDGRIAQLARTKGGPQCRVISELAARVIRRRPPKTKSPFVFWGRRNDHGVTKNAMRYTLGQAADIAKVENPGLRRFRYTVATVMANSGVPDLHASKLLGHADIRQTRGYQLAMFEEVKKSADMVALLIGGESC